MTEFAYTCLGEMLEGLGKALKDPQSDVRKSFKLSREQLMTLLGVIRIAGSPDVQKKYIGDLAFRWDVSERTIRTWIGDGYIRPGRKVAGDSRRFWYADEVDEDERKLINRGLVKPQKHHRLRYFMKMINGIL